MRNRTRVIAAAAVVTAALAAGGTAATAASTSGVKPGTHAKTVSASVRCAPDSDLAARIGVSQARLDQALRAVKISLVKSGGQPTEGQFDAALARVLGVPQARVRQALAAAKACGAKPVKSKSGAQPGNEPLAAAVARELHLSAAQVNAALRPLLAAGRADPSSAAFATAARSLGITPQRLLAALVQAKQSLAGGN
jgi:hypothetical protein